MVFKKMTSYEKELLTEKEKLRNTDYWTSYLKTAAMQYKHSFDVQTAIHAANPNYIACASAEFWNSKDCRINPNAKAIYVRNNGKTQKLFDISDVTGDFTSEYWIWSMQDSTYNKDYTEKVLNTLNDRYSMKNDTLEESIYNLTLAKTAEKINVNSDLYSVVAESAAFMAIERCCPDTAEMSPESLSALGRISIDEIGLNVTAIAREVLSEIEHIVKQERNLIIEDERNRGKENGREISNESDRRTVERSESEQQRGLSHSSSAQRDNVGTGHGDIHLQNSIQEDSRPESDNRGDENGIGERVHRDGERRSVLNEGTANAPSVSSAESKPKAQIFGNTEYKYIPQKSYRKYDNAIADRIADILRESDMKYSGKREENTTTFTVSRPNVGRLEDIAKSVTEEIELENSYIDTAETVDIQQDTKKFASGELESNIAESVENIENALTQAADQPQENAPQREKTFSEQVDEVLNGTANRYNDIKVCDTPQILIDCGLEQLPMLYTQRHLRKAVEPKDLQKHNHGLTVEQLKKIPELLQTPLVIYDSLNRNDSVIVVTSEIDNYNEPIIVSIQANGEGRYNLERVDSNFITSIYGRENIDKQLDRASNDNHILFIDKEKSQELFSLLRLQFSEGLNNLDSNIIIHQSRNIVNRQTAEIEENLKDRLEVNDELPIPEYDDEPLEPVPPAVIEKYGLEIDFNNITSLTIENQKLVSVSSKDMDGHEHKDEFTMRKTEIVFVNINNQLYRTERSDHPDDFPYDSRTSLDGAVREVLENLDKSLESADISIYITHKDGRTENLNASELLKAQQAVNNWKPYIIADMKTWHDNSETRSELERFDSMEQAVKRFSELRNMPYNSESGFLNADGIPVARLTLGIENEAGTGAMDIIHVRNGENYLCDDFERLYNSNDDRYDSGKLFEAVKSITKQIVPDKIIQNENTPEILDIKAWKSPIKEYVLAEKAESTLHFGRLGNGTTVYDTSRTDRETHDYPTVAHISDEGVVNIYDNTLSERDMQLINNEARKARRDFYAEWDKLTTDAQYQRLLDNTDIVTSMNIMAERDYISREEVIEKYMPFVFFKEGERPEPEVIWKPEMGFANQPTVYSTTIADKLFYLEPNETGDGYNITTEFSDGNIKPFSEDFMDIPTLEEAKDIFYESVDDIIIFADEFKKAAEKNNEVEVQEQAENEEYSKEKFTKNPDTRSVTWDYYNPEGNNGNGQFVSVQIYDDDIEKAMQYANGDVGIFIDYINENCKTELIDRGTEDFEAFEKHFIEDNYDLVIDSNLSNSEVYSFLSDYLTELQKNEELKEAFMNGDIESLIADDSLSSDDWEELAYPLFENKYIDKHKPSEKAILGSGGLSEVKLYELADRFRNGEDIREELAYGLLKGEFVRSANGFHVVLNEGKLVKERIYDSKELEKHMLRMEYGDDGHVRCTLDNNYERVLTYAEIGQTFLDLIHEEWNDLAYWAVLDYIKDDIPDISDETVKELIAAFDSSIMHDWENNTVVINRIKKSLHNILGDEDKTEKAFACIAKWKYSVEVEKETIKYQIYQLPNGEKYHGIRYESMEQLVKDGVLLNHEDYDLVYEGTLDSFEGNSTLESIYTRFNTNRPDDFKGRSLSVSDVIEIENEGKQTAYFCDKAGYKEMPYFFKEKEFLYEETAEHTAEAVKSIFRNLPTITCEWSESDEFEGGKTYTVGEFDTTMEMADRMFVEEKQKAIERYGSESAWSESNDATTIFMGYEKVKFTVNMPDGRTITERQDIGDGHGGVIDFLKKFGYADIAAELEQVRDMLKREAIEKFSKSFPELSNNSANEKEAEAIAENRENENYRQTEWNPVTESDDEETGKHTVYSTKVNGKWFWLEATPNGWAITTEFSNGEIKPVSEEYEHFSNRIMAETYFDDDLENIKRIADLYPVNRDNENTPKLMSDANEVDMTVSQPHDVEPITLEFVGIKYNLQAVRDGAFSLGATATWLDGDMLSISTYENHREEILDLAKEHNVRYIRKDPMDRAIDLINDFSVEEHNQEANFSNMNHIDLAYTTDPDTELPIEVFADLESFRIVKMYDNTLVSEQLYNDVADMLGDLANLDFDELVALTDDEKAIVETPEQVNLVTTPFVDGVNVYQALISEIVSGQGLQHSKEYVQQYFNEHSMSTEELAEFIKSEYGTGGHDGEGKIKHISYNENGMQLDFSNGESYLHSWINVATAFRARLESNTYLTPVEQGMEVTPLKLVFTGDSKALDTLSRRAGSVDNVSVQDIKDNRLVVDTYEHQRDMWQQLANEVGAEMSERTVLKLDGNMREIPIEKGDRDQFASGELEDSVNTSVTQHDVETLRQIEPRKSILNFNDSEKSLTHHWEQRFLDDIKEKSPYVRSQNDWRENESNTVPIIGIVDRNADFKTVSDDIKSQVIYRGECRNLDTNWSVQVSRRGLEDSLTYARRHNDSTLYQMMYNVSDIIQNAVLLDSVVSEQNNSNKANNTAFMHKFYSVCRLDNEPYLAKITVEEFLNSDNDTLKRLYNVQDIKIEPLRHAAFTDNQLALSVLNDSKISISDLFKIVKSEDKDFYLNKRVPTVERENSIISDFRSKTAENFHLINGMAADEIEKEIKDYAKTVLSANGIEAEISDAVLIGSRCRGIEKVNSDIDVVIEVSSDQKEDALFNLFNEIPYEINGIKVDINPIKANETGTLETYLPKCEKYLEEKSAFPRITKDLFDLNSIESSLGLTTISLKTSDELKKRFAERGLSPIKYDLDSKEIIFETDYKTWNRFAIPFYSGNLGNNIDMDDILTVSERSEIMEMLDSLNREQKTADLPKITKDLFDLENIRTNGAATIIIPMKTNEALKSRFADSGLSPAQHDLNSKEIVLLTNNKDWYAFSIPNNNGRNLVNSISMDSVLTDAERAEVMELISQSQQLLNDAVQQGQQNQKSFEEQQIPLFGMEEEQPNETQEKGADERAEAKGKADNENTIAVGDKFSRKIDGSVVEVVALSGALPWYQDDVTVKGMSGGIEITSNISADKLLDERLYERVEAAENAIEAQQETKAAESSSADKYSNVTNLNQLKNTIKVGDVFEITDHQRAEAVGERRVITSVNTVGFTSQKLDEKGEPVSRDIYMEWGKASDWTFENGVFTSRIKATHREKNINEIIMQFHFIDNGIEYAKEEQISDYPVKSDTPENALDSVTSNDEPDEKGNINLRKVGDFYEVYGDEAIAVSEQLGLHLTVKNGLEMVGFPDSKKSEYSVKLRDAGYTVLIEEVFELNPSNREELNNAVEEVSEENTKETPENYSINVDEYDLGGAKSKFKANVEAIKMMKQLDREGRKYANPEEQAVMAKYTGWGGLANAFDENRSDWSDEYAQLKELLTDEEYTSARSTVTDAFYTPPYIINSIYKALDNFGFKNGTILDPSTGIGNFIGMMPAEMKNRSKITATEIDRVSGRIAQYLYPLTNVEITGFEKKNLADNSFDVVVGNVPFGNIRINDRRYNKHNFMIHDYFFAKSLDKVRAGGIVAFITSTSTMDKQNSSVRKYISERAELLGAVRLPNSTFKSYAGTEVSSDIIFLQKREHNIDLAPDWVYTGKYQNENGEFTMNQYFIDNPDMVLGNVVLNKLYGRGASVEAFENADLKDLLEKAIAKIQGKYEEQTVEIAEKDELENAIPADPDVRNFSFTKVDNKIYFRRGNYMTLEGITGRKAERVTGMINISKCVHELLDMQLEGYPETSLSAKRRELNELYDKFTKEYGLLNSRENANLFSEDISSPLLLSLEEIQDGKLIRKADIFTKTTLKPPEKVTSVSNVHDALIVSISEKAKVDLDFMSELLNGADKEKIISDLKGSIYFDPQLKEYQTADEYLSGNIRKKIQEAKYLLPTNPEMADNIAALETVMPEPLQAADIVAKLGSPWIDEKYIEQFIREKLEIPRWFSSFNSVKVSHNKYSAEWNIANKAKIAGASPVNSTEVYGTNRKNALEIIEASLNQRGATVYDKVYNPEKQREERVVNHDETLAAQQKQAQLEREFTEWIFADPERRNDLVEKYNVLYNSTRLRHYDGSHLNFVGMNADISLKPHQRDAIAHALYGGNTLFAHKVGAGKTFEMIATAMEGKRLGIHNKSLIAVPNHMTVQFANDFLKLYPNANILVADKKDFSAKNRRKLCAKIATGDFDAVIIGHTQLLKIPVSTETEEKYIQEQIDEVEKHLIEASAIDPKGFSAKSLEKTKKNLQAKLEDLLSRPQRDQTVTFEQLGIDRLIIDEADMFKNLAVVTKMHNVAGIATNSDVQKTQDLFMKCRYIDDLTNHKGITFATGTPISNSITEAYIMNRYLNLPLLKENNVESFDAWAANFAEKVTRLEFAPSGKGFRQKTRVSKFNNLPELKAMFKSFTDVKMAEDLNLPEPECERHIVTAKRSEAQEQLMEGLAERADRIHNKQVTPDQDNMLKITSDGTKIGLDPRLINPLLPDFEGSKVNLCVDNVADIYKEKSAEKLTQVIFCDYSTPKYSDKEGFSSVYEDIKKKLIEKGIPEKEIAFIHDCKNDRQKQQLYDKVKSGDVRVILGSTQKLGAGTNMQDRLYAMHHLDCPWKPRDMEQRLGRMKRQGNINEKVHEYIYVTQDTFDAYRFQTLETKQGYISQMMSNSNPLRSCEDISQDEMGFATVKAACVGDPRIKEKMELDIRVNELQVLKKSFLNSRYRLEDNAKIHFPKQIAEYTKAYENSQKDIETSKRFPKVLDDEGKQKFYGITLNGKTFTDKEQAGKELINAVAKSLMGNMNKRVDIGEYKGFRLEAYFDILSGTNHIDICGNHKYQIELSQSESGNIQRLDNKIAAIPDISENFKNELENVTKQLEDAKEQLAVTFPQEQELQEKLARLDVLNAELAKEDNDKELGEDNSKSFELATEEEKQQAEEREKARKQRELDGNYSDIDDDFSL